MHTAKRFNICGIRNRELNDMVIREVLLSLVKTHFPNLVTKALIFES